MVGVCLGLLQRRGAVLLAKSFANLAGVTNTPTSPKKSPVTDTDTPVDFSRAMASMHEAVLRPEITLGIIRPPQRLAPFSHAIGLEVTRPESIKPMSTDAEGDAFGRLILLHDPGADDVWEGPLRLVAYIQADMDHSLAGDPLLPEVAWDWLTEGLSEGGAEYSNLGGTVTSTASVRFGEITGPPSAYQIEMRASWTAASVELAPHVVAFSKVLAHVAGLPPEGVTALNNGVNV